MSSVSKENFNNDRSPGSCQTVGHTEEPLVHELRQDVQSLALLLQGKHPQEGAG